MIDLAMTTLTQSAFHPSLKGKEDLRIRYALGLGLQYGISIHHRGTDDNTVGLGGIDINLWETGW